MSSFGDNLKKLREQRGITVSTLSEATGISRRTIYSWEKGIAIPSAFSSRKLLAEFFHVDPFFFDNGNGLADDPLIKNILIRVEELERKMKMSIMDIPKINK